MGCFGKCCFGITAAIGIVSVILGVSLGKIKLHYPQIKVKNNIHPGWGIGPAVVKSMVHDTLDLTDEDSDGYINFVSN